MIFSRPSTFVLNSQRMCWNTSLAMSDCPHPPVYNSIHHCLNPRNGKPEQQHTQKGRKTKSHIQLRNSTLNSPSNRRPTMIAVDDVKCSTRLAMAQGRVRTSSSHNVQSAIAIAMCTTPPPSDPEINHKNENPPLNFYHVIIGSTPPARIRSSRHHNLRLHD
jgi:hypothetical protein